MMKPVLPSAVVAATALIAAPAVTAQNCYDNPNQCFSLAPPGGGVGKVGGGLQLRSESLKVTGDIRLRMRAAETPTGVAYNDNDQYATRARVKLEYQATDNASVVLEYNHSETWAGAEGYSDAQPGENFNGIAQAYCQVDDMFGFGDKWRFGRSNYILGNGLILGSCDYLQAPARFTGLWISKNFGGHDVELFGLDNEGPLHALAPATRYWGATASLNISEDGALQSIRPYYMAGTNDGDTQNEDTWIGVQVNGEVPGGVDWSADWAQRNVEVGDDVMAYSLRVSKALEGVLNGISFTRTDSEGALHVNPADFNSAGLLHQYGGAWRSDLATNQLGLSFAPVENLDLDVNLLSLDRGDTVVQQGDFEVDLMCGRLLDSGVYVWVGYGFDNDDRQVGFVQLTTYF